MRFLLALALMTGTAAAEPKGLIAVPDPIAAPALDVADRSGAIYRMVGLPRQAADRVVLGFVVCAVPGGDALARLDDATDDDALAVLAVLAVNLADTPKKIGWFLDKVDTGALTILTDPGNTLAEPWHVVGLPITYVVAPEGALALVALGAREWNDPALVARIMAVGAAD